MRWIVLLLLMVNLIYAVWHLLQDDVGRPAAEIRSPQREDLPRLRLLEEVAGPARSETGQSSD